jgi:hypothetical protein
LSSLAELDNTVEIRLYVDIDHGFEKRIEAIDDIEVEYSSDYDIFKSINKMNTKKKEINLNLLGNKRKREEDIQRFIKTYKNVKYVDLKKLEFKIEVVEDIPESTSNVGIVRNEFRVIFFDFRI